VARIYSGVPKARAPVFIFSLEIKVPNAQAGQGLINYAKATVDNAFAIDCATASYKVTDTIAQPK
jgi:hypothetical protein